ncbi:APC family permease [Planctomycetes bacterium K23_9]|uniref:Serine/threonine exchanger SteT n=1 Tax=Stieleria marina TaxID=1930275 RepID=A0A517NMM7_9BACT|nr:Serine/threonine exchanger SteT [Planctomycetes bacterium K23_9]
MSNPPPTSESVETHQNDVGSGGNDKRPLGLLSATTIVAASMIGAGVYTTSGFTLGDLGDPFWVVVAWMVAGMIAICGAICYGALASEFADSGGEYLFLSKALHPVAGLMAGWVSLLAGFTGAIAFAATTFAEYLSPEAEIFQAKGIAIALVAAAAILHSIGVRTGARVQDLAVVLKVLLIGVFISVAAWHEWPRSIVAAVAVNPEEPESGTYQFALAFATSLMWISLSYSGFNAAVYVAGEVENPRRNVPRALLLGTIGVTVIYVLLNAIFVYAPRAEDIKFNPQIAAVAAKAIGGEWFERFVRVVILFGLFTSVSALVMTGPRVYAKMAEDGFLPRVFRFQGRVPVVAIWIQAILAMIVISFSTLKDLLGYLGFTLSVSAALTAGLVFWLHGRDTSRVHVKLFPLPPIVFVGGTLLTATLSAISSPWQAMVGLGTIGFGLLFYPWYRMRHST